MVHLAMSLFCNSVLKFTFPSTVTVSDVTVLVSSAAMQDMPISNAAHSTQHSAEREDIYTSSVVQAIPAMKHVRSSVTGEKHWFVFKFMSLKKPIYSVAYILE